MKLKLKWKIVVFLNLEEINESITGQYWKIKKKTHIPQFIIITTVSHKNNFKESLAPWSLVSSVFYLKIIANSVLIFLNWKFSFDDLLKVTLQKSLKI